MKRVILLITGLVFLAATAWGAVEARFMTQPDIHGDTLVFTYEGDLWQVGTDGGLAVRLTSYPGEETFARYSPDGQWLAFSGEYDGPICAYVIPADGGIPRRLTYRPGARVVTWTPDGRQIVFSSGYENTFRPVPRLYTVALNGGMPERMPVPRGVLCSFSPDGRQMVYNPRGREEYYWKRYKGGQYMDIWLTDLDAGTFKPLTTYVGKNAYPMWIGRQMYFVSDRGSAGIANLYRYDFASGKSEQVTHYSDFDVQMPSTDGQRIVYLQAGYLHILDPRDGKDHQVAVRIPTDQWEVAPRTINPAEYIQSMSVSDDGKQVLFEARGDVFSVPVDDKQKTRNLTRTGGTRERFPQLSPDGQWVAFFSDRSGEYQLYIRPAADPQAEWQALTHDLKTTLYHLEWSPDSKKIMFGTKELAIYYVDVDSGTLTKVDESHQLKNDEFTWEVSDYTWSPDSNWIAFSRVEYNRNNRIYLFHLTDGQRTAVTDGFYDSLNPAFDTRGGYLYFLSYRKFNVQLDIFEDDHIIAKPVQVMAVQLHAGEKPPFDETSDITTDNDKKEPAPFRIDLEGLAQRVFPFPVKSGNYFHLKAGAGIVAWDSIDNFTEDELEEIFAPGGRTKWTLHLYDMPARKEARVDGTLAEWRLSTDGSRIVARRNKDYFVAALADLFKSKSFKDKLNLEHMSYTVVPREEWAQIQRDAWRWYRDFFYDPNMHGRDWKAIGDKFAAWIPQLTSRDQLNNALSQMVGELSVSHTYIFGGDSGPRPEIKHRLHTGLLGADLAADASGYYRFTVIYGPTAYNLDLDGPLVRPDLPLKEGDFLIAIDGHPIRTTDNPFRYLQVARDQMVDITVNSSPSPEGAVTRSIMPITNEYRLRYERWVADNIRKVEEATNGEVGYLHLTAMGSGNIGQFDKYWRAFRYKKGLVIDVRGNGGGWTEYFMIDKLERQRIAYNCLKNMEPFPYPGGASTAKYVVISNEYNGSDGELFIEHFKARKLGTVVGVPSWGGLVGIINQERTIDNGIVWQSNNAFYGREDKWFVENHGADPDIRVDNDPASVMAGHDPQLEKAIEVVKKQIAEHPFTFPPKPAYPKK